MALGRKISDMPAIDASELTETDVFVIVDVNGVPGQKNKKLSVLELMKEMMVSGLESSRVLVTDESGNIKVSTVTVAQLEALSGVTSNIQTQINNNASLVINRESFSVDFKADSTTVVFNVDTIGATGSINGDNGIEETYATLSEIAPKQETTEFTP